MCDETSQRYREIPLPVTLVNIAISVFLKGMNGMPMFYTSVTKIETTTGQETIDCLVSTMGY